MSATRDIDRLQGRWRQVASSVDGAPEAEAADGDEFAGDMVTAFTDVSFQVFDGSGATVLAGRFVLDEAARAIDWIDSMGADAGAVLPARYELTATTFAFAAADAGAPRPARVAPSPGVVLRRFVRE